MSSVRERIRFLTVDGWNFTYSIQSGHISLTAKKIDSRFFNMPGVWGNSHTVSSGIHIEKVINEPGEFDKFLSKFIEKVEKEDGKIKEFFYNFDRLNDYLELVGFKKK